MSSRLSLALVVLLTLLCHAGAQAQGLPRASWYDCRLTLRATTVLRRSCVAYPMPKALARPTGYWIRRTVLDSTHERSVRYPEFRLRAHRHSAPLRAAAVQAPISHLLGYFLITGYSYGCGDANGITASGTVPAVGTIANDSLPFGTHVSIPSLGYAGIVLDRGVGTGGFDLFAPSCGATYAYTGYRAVYTY